jgi:hypothetical protein
MPVLTTLPQEFEVLERTTTRLSGTLTQDDALTPAPASLLTTLTLKLYALDAARTIINSRDNQTVKNANGGTVNEAGLLVMVFDPADIPMLDSALPYERHIALFTWTWGSSPVKTGRKEVALIVRNLHYVP